MSTAGAARESVSMVGGRYQVGRQLAVGGMGVIFHAYDTLARREIAYKRLKVENENTRPRLTALFEREYNALRQLKHPNIVEVYDYGLDAEGPYYTMELLDGRDLAAAAPLPLTESCRLLREVASALALLHARRLVHRDVTPANVRLTKDGRAKLIDFGALTEFGVAREIVGTPAFIAPECLAGEALDGRADLFALGGVAYWALARRHAYRARTIDELSDAWEIPVSPLSEHLADVPRELDALVLSLLERDALARPSSAAHVIERLSAIADLPPEQDETDVAHSYLLHPPLVGRGVVIERLRRLAGDAANGEGCAVMIESGSGLGRSALLDQVAVDAQQSGANVLHFQPSGKREAGLAHAITHWMRAVFPELWREQLSQNPLLARETRAPLRAAESLGAVTEARAKLVTAIQNCVAGMCQRAPLTLLIDDVHRADPESLALIATLARDASSSRLLLVTTQEERAVGSDANALAGVRAASDLIRLEPLFASDVEMLVEMVFGNVTNGHRLARFLHKQSGGNPGQCMDVCRLLLQRGEIRYAQGTFALPFDPSGEALGARALELSRVVDLDPAALRLVHLLALSDGALNVAQAASALESDADQLLAAGELLAARALVRLSEGELSLSSESLRSALRAAVPEEERAALHRGLSRGILAHGDGSIETKFVACHHLLCAGDDDQALALVWEPLRVTTLPLGSTAACVPVLVRLLDVMRKRGHSDEQCWSLLAPLVVAGYWGDFGTVSPYRDAALTALGNMTGINLARRLSPSLGNKLALFIGILVGIVRFVCTPQKFRPPNFAEALQRFFSSVTMATATAASALDAETAINVAAMLDPFSSAKENSQARIAREFAVATAEVAAGLVQQSADRYAWILDQLSKQQIFDPMIQSGFVDGCRHGRAAAEVTAGSPRALQAADELASGDPFFRPHAEAIRMAFHGYRGDKERQTYHRKQGELLALQGGLSWSAFTALSIRSAYIAMMTQDTLGVVQAGVDFERLSSIAPMCLLYRDLCRAYVATMRGQAQEAIAIYERIRALPRADLMPTIELDAACYAEALVRVGRIDDAKRVCEEALAMRRAQGTNEFTLRAVSQQLALIEAKLGDTAAAKERFAKLMPVVAASESPLFIGGVYRDLARVAMIERDTASFERHFEVMVTNFKSTKNPGLIQQCRRILSEAEKAGVVVAPNWEKHDLGAPANTQDRLSQLDDVTELVAAS